MRVFFRHDSLRKGQETIIREVARTVVDRDHLLLQAHTGHGKTDAVLSAAVSAALDQGMRVLFLTPKKSQHALAIQVIKDLNEKHGLELSAADVLGKREYCLSRAREVSEFYEYCSLLKKRGLCPYYSEYRRAGGPDLPLVRGKKEVLNACRRARIPPCPYEVLLDSAQDADVIVADYNYLFSGIRKIFLARTRISLPETILVVDEAHNLADRVRDNMSATLTNSTLQKAVREARELGEDAGELEALTRIIPSYAEDPETIMEKPEVPCPDLKNLWRLGMEWLESHEKSSLLKVWSFFMAWEQEGPEFFRILRKKERGFSLSVKCLDPGNVTEHVFSKAGASILMSATLSPFDIHTRLLRIREHRTLSVPPVFPPENRLCLVSSASTSRWSERSDQEYERMARIASELKRVTPGNTVVFFPSFEFMKEVSSRTRTAHVCQAAQGVGGVLDSMGGEGNALVYAVSGGVLAEGVNLPGVRTVVVAGLPVPSPDPEQLALQEYYERMFGRGYEYAFLYPALRKALQAAGRCIRGEKQKGVIVFLDHRFRRYLPMIRNYYPDARLAGDPVPMVQEFWSVRASCARSGSSSPESRIL